MLLYEGEKSALNSSHRNQKELTIKNVFWNSNFYRLWSNNTRYGKLNSHAFGNVKFAEIHLENSCTVDWIASIDFYNVTRWSLRFKR